MSDYEPTQDRDAGPLFAVAHGVPEEDKTRAETQCSKIHEMLKSGPCTNRQLSQVSMKYTSRISDLRKQGVNIPKPENLGGGLTEYRIEE